MVQPLPQSVSLPTNGRPERAQTLLWMAQEMAYVHNKFGETEDPYRDNGLKEFFDIDDFWRPRVVQYYDRARLFLQEAAACNQSDDPALKEKQAQFELLAKQAVAKAAMTARDAVESMIRVFGDMPKPGLSSGNIEEWPDVKLSK